MLHGRCSPDNQCFAEDGDVLHPPLPKQQVGQAEPPRNYYFLSAKGDGKRSKFGWVKRSERPFSVEEFVAEHPIINRNEEQTSLLTTLFSAIANLPEGPPVTGSYFQRGVEQHPPELSFHKVFFYPDREGEPRTNH